MTDETRETRGLATAERERDEARLESDRRLAMLDKVVSVVRDYGGGDVHYELAAEAVKELAEGYIAERIAARKALAARQSDPPGLREALGRALPALIANRPPDGQTAYSQVREAIDILRAAYDLSAPAPPAPMPTKGDE